MYSKDTYKTYKIEKSKRKNKKYDMILQNKTDKEKFVRISFGDTRYGQYSDKTPLKAYTHKNFKAKDNPKKRRQLYRERHRKNYNLQKARNIWSAAEFSWKYLW